MCLQWLLRLIFITSRPYWAIRASWYQEFESAPIKQKKKAIIRNLIAKVVATTVSAAQKDITAA